MKKYTAVVKKWFDKVNGNTYHSVRIIRHSDEAVCVAPFQYGYGSQYEQSTFEAMESAGWIESPKDTPPICYNRDNGYPVIFTVSDGLKRACVSNGEV